MPNRRGALRGPAELALPQVQQVAISVVDRAFVLRRGDGARPLFSDDNRSDSVPFPSCCRRNCDAHTPDCFNVTVYNARYVEAPYHQTASAISAVWNSILALM